MGIIHSLRQCWPMFCSIRFPKTRFVSKNFLCSLRERHHSDCDRISVKLPHGATIFVSIGNDLVVHNCGGVALSMLACFLWSLGGEGVRSVSTSAHREHTNERGCGLRRDGRTSRCHRFSHNWYASVEQHSTLQHLASDSPVPGCLLGG